MIVLRLFFTLLVFTLPTIVKAQIKYADNLGTDFWMVFPPNYHNELFGGGGGMFQDSLYIYIAATKPTNVTVTATDKNGGINTKNLTINDVTKVYKLQYSWRMYEILGFNNSGELQHTSRQDEVVSEQAFHITSDEEITVYALSDAETSTDAALILPTDVLSKAYCVASYNSDGSGTTSTPSQFVVLAVEDNTQVRIEPKVKTSKNNSAPYNVTLNKGQSYLVQANTSSTSGGSSQADLTGSFVTSSKPVAVFSGHQRSKIPSSFPTGSRDLLFEQLPGVETWGKSTVVVPFATAINARTDGNDLFRVIAAYDSTKVFLDEKETALINRGGFYELALTKPIKVNSSKPVMVTCYKKTSGEGFAGGNFKTGDPFMTVTPPTDQFLPSYLFVSPQVTRNSSPEYDYQYVTIVVPNSAVDSVTLDGVVLQQNIFTQIGQSGFSYSNRSLTDGTHTISCTKPIGIYVYGYGNAVSYGYVGGMRFRPLDNNPPEIGSNINCYNFTGTVYDTLPGDSKIMSVEVPENTKNNVTVVSSFNPNADSVKLDATLVNRYLDGSFTVVATDSVLQKTEKNYSIPGFTVSATSKKESLTPITIERKLAAGRRFCFLVELENYGSYIQNLPFISLRKGNAGFVINDGKPITLKPGEKKEITVCFDSQIDSLFTDTLFIGNSCLQRNTYVFSFRTIIDRIKPGATVFNDECKTKWELNFTELEDTDLGLREIIIVDSLLINCSASIEKKDSLQGFVRINVIDNNQDAEFTVTAVDSVGNRTTIQRVIPGYTLSFLGLTNTDEPAKDFSNVSIGTVRCDSVLLYNYGKYSITLSSFALNANIRYSIPPSQFPLTIEPKDSVQLVMCYEPKYVDNKLDEDLISLRYNCSDKFLKMIGKAVKINEVQNYQCDIPIKITSVGEKESSSILSVFPQPVTDILTVEYEIHKENQLTYSISLVDAEGNMRLVKPIGTETNGTYLINFSLELLESGTYSCILSNGLNSSVKSVIIVK